MALPFNWGTLQVMEANDKSNNMENPRLIVCRLNQISQKVLWSSISMIITKCLLVWHHTGESSCKWGMVTFVDYFYLVLISLDISGHKWLNWLWSCSINNWNGKIVTYNMYTFCNTWVWRHCLRRMGEDIFLLLILISKIFHVKGRWETIKAM